jgi:hypothetical protein
LIVGANNEQRTTNNEILGVFALFLLASLAFAQSYMRWLDPLIDTGRDLYIPEQLLHGARLYRDIRYQYPPLAPYLLALLTALVGHSLASYMVIGVGQSLAAAGALYAGARKAGGALGAFIATMLFVSLNFTSATTWGVTWIFPYAYAATFGMTLLLIALAALLYDKPWPAMLALWLASWCKVELAAAAMLIVIGLTVTRHLPWRAALGYMALMAASVAAAAAYFGAPLRENVFASLLLRGEPARLFFARVSGTAYWQANVGWAVVGLAVLGGSVWLVRRGHIAAGALLAVLGALAGDDPLIRAFGILQWVVLLAAVRNRTLFTIALVSAAATLRIWLNVSPGWYGFTLVVPVYVLMAALLPKRAAAIWLLPALVISGRGLVEQDERFAQKTHPIVSTRGTFYDANPDRASMLTAMLQRVHGGTLAVIPEGITLNYLAEARTPLTFHTFTPVEIDEPHIEAAILRELEAHPPQHIALVDRDVREFGYRGFGVDYAQAPAAWIRAHYTPEARWRSPRFWLVLLRR